MYNVNIICKLSVACVCDLLSYAHYTLLGDGFGLLVTQLSAPGHPALGRGAGTMVAVLCIAGGLLTFRLPVVPSLWTDMASHLTVDEERGTIVAPGTSEINLANALVGGECTAMEHIAIGDITRRRGGSDIGVGFTANLTLLKPSC